MTVCVLGRKSNKVTTDVDVKRAMMSGRAIVNVIRKTCISTTGVKDIRMIRKGTVTWVTDIQVSVIRGCVMAGVKYTARCYTTALMRTKCNEICHTFLL